MLSLNSIFRMVKICVLFYPFVTFASTFTVTNSNASGQGSLSWAIAESQSHAGADTIVFALSTSDANFNGQYWQIKLQDVLPQITDDSTYIDGFSQSLLNNTNPVGPEIEINGELCPYGSVGLDIRSAFNIIRGIALGGFQASGISMRGENAHDNVVSGCYIGISADGQHALSNGLNGVECIYGAEKNRIGGSSESERNIISGNKRYGVRIELAGYNTVVGNYIGIDYSGLVAVPNGSEPRKWAGVYIATDAKHNIIGDGTPQGRNVISGNHRTGIRIEWSGADSNTVQGNYIGVGADGRTKIPNGEAGLVIGRGASYNLIGGDEADDANVISGNHSSGIQFARASYKNVLKGNLIGTDATGEEVVPNDHNGIYFYGNEEEGYPQYNVIGPNNVICGNGVSPPSQWWAGLSMDFPGTAYNHCYGNYIGVNRSGTLIDGQPTGVLIQRGAHNNIIGPDNIIAYSDYNGVHVMHDSTVANKITQNRIFANKGLAIYNVNGGNNELPPPVIKKIEKTTVEGTALANAVVEIYADPAGQARQYLGATQADDNGRFSWSGDLPEMLITALEIDQAGNTSELAVGSVVPVELVSFRISVQENHIVRLFWQTASESNNLGFYVQRRRGAADYQDIAFLPGRGTTSQPVDYSYIDSLQYAGTYFYRLKQTDTDGSTQFSNEIRIVIAESAPMAGFQVYPNPSNNATKVSFYLNEPEEISLEVFDLLGRRIKILYEGRIGGGQHEIVWDGTDSYGRPVATGDYFVLLKSSRFKRTKKVLLLK